MFLIYLYDDKITIIFNSGDKPVTIDDELLSDIEESNEAVEGSFLDPVAPPLGMPTVFWTAFFGLREHCRHFSYCNCRIEFFFHLIGRQITQSLVGAIVVVKVDVAGHCGPKLFFTFVEIAAEVLLLDRCKE